MIDYKFRSVPKLQKIEYIFLALVCIISLIRRIVINVHIDEEIIISMGYRVIQGDTFFSQIQEPQLLIAPLIAMMEIPFVMITGGTSGILLYMKCVMAVIIIISSVLTYIVLQSEIGKSSALFASLVCFFYHYRYINVTDYTFLFNISMLMCILALIVYKKTQRTLSIIWGATSFCIAVVSFPSVIFIFPLYIILIGDKNNKKDILLFLFTCILLGMIEISVLISGNDLTKISGLIRNIISGSTYMKKEINFIFKVIQGLLCVCVIPMVSFQKDLLIKYYKKIGKYRFEIFLGGGADLWFITVFNRNKRFNI